MCATPNTLAYNYDIFKTTPFNQSVRIIKLKRNVSHVVLDVEYHRPKTRVVKLTGMSKYLLSNRHFEEP